ncbi:amidohydrolase [Alkalihalobacillus deserti]|uniref:amidohydrolase n=1 Tax=Alkalihalobacillus deserti TaxID=2879466 RepID=UPI001D159859|nr:amidohydrolase [Alkalihalobacillus deserti]
MVKKTFIFLFIVCLIGSMGTNWGTMAITQDEVADLVFENGEIYTVDKERSWAEAVAVKDGVIAYVGSNEGVAPFKGPDTEVVDLKGKMVTPGIIDSHNHAYLMAESLFWLDLNPYRTVEEYQQGIKQYLEENSELEQLRGVGFREALVTNHPSGLLPKELLDEVVSDIPAVFITNGHHDIWVNSKALELAGIDKDTPDPQGGMIDRDPETGEPTGILREFSAQNLVIDELPQPDFTVEEYEEALLAFQEAAAMRGTTSVFVPIHYPTESLLQAFQKLDDTKQLTVRYDLGLWADETKGADQIDTFIEMRDKYQGELFNITSIKIFADGHGHLVWEQDDLEETFAALDKEKFRIYIHAIGNMDIDPVGYSLDAIEYAFEQNGIRDARHAITHVPWVKEEDLARFKDLGVIPIGQPAWFHRDRGATTEEEFENLNRLKSYFEAGIPFVSSSDYPVSDFWPLEGIEVGMTRLPPSETNLDKVLWPKERASLEEMLSSYTISGAHAIFLEEEIGSIEVGKKADLTVIEKNLFDLPVTDISETKILMTLFEGQEVFRHPSFISATDIKVAIDRFEAEGEFKNHGVARSLQAQLSNAERFEEREEAEKLVKHVQDFQQLLEKHKNNGLMSETAYNYLKSSADALIEKW